MGTKLLIKAVMAPFSCQIEVNISQGRQKSIGGIAFPVISIDKGKTEPVRKRKTSPRDKGRKKSTRMALLHEKRFPAFNEHFCLDGIGVEGSYYDPLLAMDRIEVGPKNAVWVRMFDPDKPFYVLCRNSCQQKLFWHFDFHQAFGWLSRDDLSAMRLCGLIHESS